MGTSSNFPDPDILSDLPDSLRLGPSKLGAEARSGLLRIAADVRRLASDNPKDGKLLKSIAAMMEAVARERGPDVRRHAAGCAAGAR